MARQDLSRCKDSTSTSGTGTLTLDNSTAANWQTLKQAVDRSLAANGDTVGYTISDTSNPVIYERGTGTIGSGGLSLSRDTVGESSSGGSLISWPSGGSRDVVITLNPEDTLNPANNLSDVADADTAADNIGAARLNAASSFTEAPQEVIKSSAGALTLLELTNSAAASTSNTSQFDFRLNSSTQERLAGRVFVNFSTTTDASRTSKMTFQTFAAGSAATPLIINGSSAEDASTNLYDALPSGTKMLFGTSPPTGWTRVNETSNRVIALSVSGDTIGTTGGSDDIFDGSWTTSGHSLSIAELASHSHQIINGSSTGFSTAVGGASTAYVPQTTAVNTGTNTTATAGSGTAHTHSMTTPAYRIACWATKD